MIRPLAFSFLALTLAAAAAQPSPAERYFDGLRSRGLFDLAESEALRRLAHKPSVDEQATLVMELARTFAEHAKYADGAEQAELADRADEAVAGFLAEHPKYPGRVRLEVLAGELALTRGETARWLAELVPDQPEHRTRATQDLGDAVARLTEAERLISRRFRDRSRSRTTEQSEPLATAELAALLTRTRLALGTAELERARLDGSDAGHLAAAEEWLEPVAKGPAAEESTWRAGTLFAEAARLAGKPDLARRRLLTIDTAGLADEAKDAVAAVSVRLWLDEGKPDEAADFLIDYRRTRGSLSGELRLLQVRSLAQAATALEKLGKKPEADGLREQIPTVVRWTEAEQGGYWAYRVRLAARDAERSGRYGVEVADQVRDAETAVAQGKTEEAAAAYTEAERLAADEPETASQFAFTRAVVLLKADRFEEAAEAFASIAARYPESARTAEAHLLSAYALGRSNDRAPSTARRDAYVARLEEHRSRFAAAPTAAEATARLARLMEGRRQYSKAIPLFKELAADPERGPSARAAVARNYENLLLHLRESRRTAATPAETAARDAQLSKWSINATRDLVALTEPLRSDVARSQPLSTQEAELALRSAQLLSGRGGDPAAADRLLDLLAEAVAADRPEAEQAFWLAARRSALPLRVISLASRNRYAEAVALVDGLVDAPVGDLLAVVRGLTELTDPTSGGSSSAAFGAVEEAAGPRLTELRQSAAELLASRRSELAPEDVRQLDLLLAKANLADGRATVAAGQYEAALADRPKDKALLTRAATELLDSGEAEAVRRARDYWRRLESLEKKGSEPWLRARLKVAESSFALGEVAEARKVLTVTTLLYPDLGSPETKAGYRAALRKTDAATSQPTTPPSRRS